MQWLIVRRDTNETVGIAFTRAEAYNDKRTYESIYNVKLSVRKDN